MQVKKGDFIIFFLIVSALLGWFTKDYIWPQSEEKSAIIEIAGEFYKEIPLTKDMDKKSFTIELGENKHLHVIAQNGGIQITKSTCPAQVCVKTGVISKVGQNIVCLPYKVIIYLEGPSNNNIDDITY